MKTESRTEAVTPCGIVDGRYNLASYACQLGNQEDACE